MIRLIPFELEKVWRKNSFLGILALLVFLNLFFLWFFHRPAENEPPLAAYKAVCNAISGMREEEKLEYITGLKEQLDGVAVVEAVQNMRGLGNKMGDTLAKQRMEQNPGIYEKYYDIYKSGEYLIYTDSLEKEIRLVEELYAEITAVADYEGYLNSVQEKSTQLSGISIFQSAEARDSFSSRNIQKSAADHSGMTSENIRWYPSRGLTMAVENQVTDLFALLSVFLFVGQLITGERGKGLFHITRATNRGMAVDMGARLFALLIHCGAVCLLLYGSNLVYAWAAAGLGSRSCALQSMAPYLESSLPLSLGIFLIVGLATKISVIFCLGLLLTACAVCTAHSFMPPLIGLGMLGVNWLLYTWIPSYSAWKALKYFSFFGLLRVEQLYGKYLNLNILGCPVSRLVCALAVLAGVILLGSTAVLLLFHRGGSLLLQRTMYSLHGHFHPHSSLLGHESYKILVAGRALLILLAFAVLIGWNDLGKTYTPSAGEQYYQSLMLSLEGELTEDKSALIAAEQTRYDEAFAQIDRIDSLTASGSISESSGENMKLQWYGELAFYPFFQRILAQYERILQNGGAFVYDTGYLYLFGTMDDSFLLDLLLLSLCFCFAFANVMAMEDSKGVWGVLSASRCGRKRIIYSKCLVCGLAAAGMALLPWLFRWLSISAAYPMRELWADVRAIPQYESFCVNVPIWTFLLLAVLIQMAAVQLISAAVLLLSQWRKNYFQTLFLALLLLAAPLILTAMGLQGTKWFSVWPLYSWTRLYG